ncbi:MAG: riboflavin synthase [Actinomycetota bacterium]|nr:riboflavin synthase [Actinomycetota bacterium]
MFTGIVEERGQVMSLHDLGDSVRLTVLSEVAATDARPGDSIAVNGCCLTVAALVDGGFAADVMRESLQRTALGALQPGAVVNLERAVSASTRMGGHLVQGHVDGTATLVSRAPSEHWDVLRFALAPELGRYLASKGSVAVDGVSLTVVEVTDVDRATEFTVSLIPTTLAGTTLGELTVGATVNVEVDVIAKYVERLLSSGSHDRAGAA